MNGEERSLLINPFVGNSGLSICIVAIRRNLAVLLIIQVIRCDNRKLPGAINVSAVHNIKHAVRPTVIANLQAVSPLD